MIKKIGFLITLLGLLVFLQPNLFKNIFFANDEVIMDDNDVTNATMRGGEGELTEYADGYNESDFGEAFDAPSDGKFVVQEEVKPIGPWEDLLQLKFAIRFDEEVDEVVFEPKFTKKIRAYQNKVIEVEGFIIPHEVAMNAMGDATDDGAKFMFSAYPLASCFFCGGAGAESVMEAYPKNPIEYTQQKVKLRGKLTFNEKDFLQLPYILKDVELVEENS